MCDGEDVVLNFSCWIFFVWMETTVHKACELIEDTTLRMGVFVFGLSLRLGSLPRGKRFASAAGLAHGGCIDKSTRPFDRSMSRKPGKSRHDTLRQRIWLGFCSNVLKSLTEVSSITAVASLTSLTLPSTNHLGSLRKMKLLNQLALFEKH